MKAMTAIGVGPARAVIFAFCAAGTLSTGCSFWHRRDPSDDSKSVKQTAPKKSWLDALRLENLRDERALEVERHLSGGV